VSYSYPGGAAPALCDVDLDLQEGALTLLAGPSAGGKSTLLRLFNGLVPQFHGGRLAGSIEVAGLDPARTPARRMAAIAGMVFQEPEAQAIAETAEDEVAFGMEQAGVPPFEMHRRLDALFDLLGIGPLRHRRLSTLSGGERQRTALASVLALEPRLLLLDEPTSQLDSEGAEAVIAALTGLRDRGLAVLVAEHRLARLLPVADSVLAVEAGQVRALTPLAAAASLDAAPPVCHLGRLLGLDPVPVAVDEARRALAGREIPLRRPVPSPCTVGAPLLEACGLSVSYGAITALGGVDLTVREGEAVALVGANGSGKSTLFRAVAGLVSPSRGAVRLAGRPAASRVQDRTAVAGLVPQDPALALYRDTVRDEVAETRKLRHMEHASGAQLARWGLEALSARNPRDLSVGQQQRVAVAAMLAHEPRLWLMDEPTRGADHLARQWLATTVRQHVHAGGAAVVATHDFETAARFATRVIGLDQGRVVFDLPAARAFAADGPCATQIARLVPGALTMEDLS